VSQRSAATAASPRFSVRMPTHKGWLTLAYLILPYTYSRTLNSNTLGIGVRCGRVKVVYSSLGSIWGSVPNYGCLPIRGRVPGLPVVLPGWGDPCAYFLGSVAVVFWGFWVRCGSVKLVSSSFGSIWGSVPNYGCPPIRGRAPGLPVVLPG